MLIFLSLWALLIFIGISKSNSDQKPFSGKQALALRGICAVEIMLGHIGLATGSKVLYLNRKAGILFVGIFFVLSGYGVAYSAEHKENYLRYFLLVRTARMLIPVYAIRTIMLGVEHFTEYFLGREHTPTVLKGFLINHNWYVWEQLGFYLVYWLACRILPKYVEATVGVLSVAFVVFAFVVGIDNPWYGSSLCFALGLYYYRFEKSRFNEDADWTKVIECQDDKNKYYMIFAGLMVILAISVAFFLYGANESILGNPVARNTASVTFCIMVIMLLYKVRIGNSVSCFLGKCSYEIFLIHPYILSILRLFDITSGIVIGALTTVLSIILAYGMHRIFDWNFRH